MRPKGDSMEQIAQIERPGVLIRALFKIGERMFGQVPTPERLMAHRLPLMFGIGGLYGAKKLADVLTYRESPRFSERERAALQFCERITRDDLEVSEECLATVREHFTEAEVVEITFIIACPIIGWLLLARSLRHFAASGASAMPSTLSATC
jgi:hypothetical protein